jgi:hypothetical protein
VGNKELKQIAYNWKSMTDTVLDLEKFSLSEMQILLSDTYKALRTYHKENVAPKEVSNILLEMYEFLYFTSLMEEKEVGVNFYQYQYISSIVAALRKGFFEADYRCEFPELKILDKNNNEFIINFENDIFEN